MIKANTEDLCRIRSRLVALFSAALLSGAGLSAVIRVQGGRDLTAHNAGLGIVALTALMVACLFFLQQLNALIRRSAEALADRNRKDEALAAQLVFLQTLIDSLPHPVCTKDIEGRYLSCNEAFCRWVGREKSAVVGRTGAEWFAATSAEDSQRRDIRILAESALSGSATEREEMVIELLDGRCCDVIETRAAFRNSEGKLAGLVLSIIDISDIRLQRDELKAAKEAADAAHEAKSTFLATMSHELRTPLNGIIGMVQVLEGTQLNRKQKEFVRLIGSSGEWLLTILNDILDLSKVEAGRLDLDCVDFDVRALVEGLIGFMAPAAERKQITVEAEIAEGVPDLLAGDPARLRQILLNLVGNAVKFTDKGGVRCVLRSLPAGPGTWRLQFTISDSGIGIAPDALKRLFEPFSQADSSVSRRYGGTGLGLAICKKFVTAMGGFISVESRVGEGSSFRVVLDFLDGRRQKPLQTGLEGPLSPLNVLLAEDNEINQLVARLLLERLGHHVVVAEDGLEVLAALDKEDFDVILMDLQMAEMDGVEACRRIRALPDGVKAAVPVIAMSANLTASVRKSCLEAGMDGFLGKPFLEDDMTACLATTTGYHLPENWHSPNSGLLTGSGAEVRGDLLGGEGEEGGAGDLSSPDLGPVLDHEAQQRIRYDLGEDRLDHLVATFRESSRQLLADLDRALAARDVAAAGRAAHTLISSAGNLGFAALSQTARRTEDAATAGDLDAVVALARDLERDRQEALEAFAHSQHLSGVL